VTDAALQSRIEKAVAKSVPVIWSNLEEKDEIARTLEGESQPAE